MNNLLSSGDSSRQKAPSGATGGGPQKSHPGGAVGGPSHLQPPSHHGKKGMIDLEQEESGFAETMDSGITRGTCVCVCTVFMIAMYWFAVVG